MEREEVDSFGRTIVVGDRGDSDRVESRDGWYMGGELLKTEIMTEKSESAREPAHNNNERPGGYNNERQGHSRGHNDRHRRGDGGGRGYQDWNPRHDNRGSPRDYGGGRGGRGGGGGRHGGNVQLGGINPPLMSFKSFMQTQREDLPPEVFNMRYDDYQVSYLREFSDSFFETTKREEWFQSRFNPVKLVQAELDNCTHAASAAAAIKSALLAKPELVKSFRLGPSYTGPAILNRLGKNAANDGQEASSNETKDELNGSLNEEGVDEAAASESDPATAVTVPVVPQEATDHAMRHCTGHSNSTLHFISIHACCTNALFKAAVLDALAASNPPITAPDRIIVGTPIWSGRPPRFERSAWVVMPTPEDAKNALRALRELKVSLPGPNDEQKGETTVGIKVQAHGSMHVPRPNYIVGEWFSASHRVVYDTIKAMEMAAKLDEVREVPEDSRLAAIIDMLPEGALELPTDKLDITMGYLRRVHYFVYYAGKKYLDEAHLLTAASNIQSRGTEYYLSASKQRVEGDSSAPVAVAADGEALDEVSKKRKERDEDAEEGAEPDNESGAGDAPVQSSSSPPREELIRKIQSDYRNDGYLASMRPKMVWTDAQDHEDAATILATQEKTVDDVLATTCKIESEGKARCCYPACNKLFKGIDFLKKHIKTKHEIFAADGMMRDAEPFIRSRYEALEPGMRPLPPVDVEVHGTIEQKGVSELWQGLFNKRIAGGGGGAVIVRENRGGRGEGRGGNERRAGGGGRGGGRERTNVQYIQPRAEENAGRTMSSYMDVDAPKVSAPATIDYGVTVLPPAKKRKVIKKAD